MKGDGNCLFRAFAHHLYGDEDAYGKIRESIVDRMIEDKRKYAWDKFGAVKLDQDEEEKKMLEEFQG